MKKEDSSVATIVKGILWAALIIGSVFFPPMLLLLIFIVVCYFIKCLIELLRPAKKLTPEMKKLLAPLTNGTLSTAAIQVFDVEECEKWVSWCERVSRDPEVAEHQGAIATIEQTLTKLNRQRLLEEM